MRFRYHVPLKVYIHGREIPGAQFPHHLAHAAVAHYQSGKEKTAILTVDNGHSANAFGYTGGLFCAGEGTQMSVLGPNYTFHGHVYNRVGKQLGWTTSAASGKLMGLAPYGKPRFFDPSMLGDYNSVFDFDENTVMDGLETTRPFLILLFPMLKIEIMIRLLPILKMYCFLFPKILPQARNTSLKSKRLILRTF